MSISTKEFWFKFVSILPLLMLFFISLNGSSVINIKFFSVNIHYILVYFWVLRRPESLGYGFIFLSGLISDVVLGFPLGVNSLTYLIICGFAAYLKNITLRTNLFKEWLYFLFTILVANSINYFLLSLFFLIELDYYELIGNIVFTFLLYYLFGYLFDIYQRLVFRKTDD